jgi:hypothetical protein
LIESPNLETDSPDEPSAAAQRPDRDGGRERKCIVAGEVLPDARLIRFVPGPDGSVVPDLARKLPGRGVWVEATRAAVDQAAAKNLFSRAAKMKLTVPADLSDLIERLSAKRCLDGLGLARREGGLVPGFEKAHIAIRSGKSKWLIEASDGARDGREKMVRAASLAPSPVPVCGAFSAEELGLALGLDNVIHVAFLAGRRAERWTEEVQRLAGFRPLLPECWREETRNGRGV